MEQHPQVLIAELKIGQNNPKLNQMKQHTHRSLECSAAGEQEGREASSAQRQGSSKGIDGGGQRGVQEEQEGRS